MWPKAALLKRQFSNKVGKAVKNPNTVQINSLSDLSNTVYNPKKASVSLPPPQVLAKYTYWDWLDISPEKRPAVVPVEQYKTLSATDMSKSETPQRCSKVLCRDYIQDSLYNPYYGYFSKNASIFKTKNGAGIDFKAIKNENAFSETVAALYTLSDDDFKKKGEHESDKSPWRQAWHTPTELFSPWYGYAIGEYVAQQFIKKYSSEPSTPLIIYEVGAGNGTLMINILDYLRDRHPELYARTQYRIIEISSKLAAEQSLSHHIRSDAHDHNCVRVHNQSILDWNVLVNEPCFFLACEVIDNFAHDCIVKTRKGDQIFQTCFLLDEYGSYTEAFEPVSDPLVQEFLNLRATGAVPEISRSEMTQWQRLSRVFWHLLFELSPKEYIPTHLLLFFKVLHRYFPNHSLVLTDFNSLPDTIDSVALNAPVVQTRYENVTVPCSSLLVSPGWFDIFFPTNFQQLQHLYAATGPGRPTGAVISHRQFLEKFAQLEKTQLQSGENPMLSFYENASFFIH